MYVNQIHLWLPCTGTLSQHVSVNNLHFVNFITYSRWKPTLATANEREHTIICPRKPMKYDPFLFTWCICTNLKNRHGKIGDKLEFEFCLKGCPSAPPNLPFSKNSLCMGKHSYVFCSDIAYSAPHYTLSRFLWSCSEPLSPDWMPGYLCTNNLTIELKISHCLFW